MSVIFKYVNYKKRPRGRPRKRWFDRVRDDLKLQGIREGEQLAKNREYGDV